MGTTTDRTSKQIKDLVRLYFMKYQARYLNDKSRFKFVEKSRRIGMTYVEAFDNALDASSGKVKEVWFSSADLSAAEEFMDYIKFWNEIIGAIAHDMGEVIIDSDNDVRVHRVRYSSGAEINVLSSNPTKFRSKGGRVILDEFAHHEQAEKLYQAAKPSTLWGAELRIISTHNGTESYFNQLAEEIKKGDEGTMSEWSLHSINLDQAIEEGLVTKVLKLKNRQANEEEITAFKKEAFSGMTEEAINEEFYLIPRSSEKSHLLTYQLIAEVSRKDILYSDMKKVEGDLYAGFDVARKRHLAVIWVLEKLGPLLYTRLIIEMPQWKFAKMKEQLYSILKHEKCRRVCIDETGQGVQIAEEAQDDFGKFKVEPVWFTNRIKEELAEYLYTQIEGQRVLIPLDKKVRDDLYSVKAVTTAAGNKRYEAPATDDGHADRFWALALALHAAKNYGGPVIVETGSARESIKTFQKYFSTPSLGDY